MAKTSQTEPEDRLAELEAALAAATQRAEAAEGKVKELEDHLAEEEVLKRASDPDAMLVRVRKGEDELDIHPSALASHRQAGWHRV